MSRSHSARVVRRFLILIVGVLLLGQFQPAGLPGQDKAAPSDEQIAKRLGLSVAQVQQIHTELGMTNDVLARFPAGGGDMLARKLSRGNIQRERALFTALTLRDEKGLIPQAAPLRAYEEALALNKKLAGDKRLAGLPVGPRVNRKNLLPAPTAGLNPDNTGWESLGPNHVGGRTRCVIVHPKDPDIMYAGSACGGVWKSTTVNGVRRWEPLDDLLCNMAVTCMVMDPTNPSVIYIGTGEGFAMGVRGGGIYKSDDAGETWKRLPIPDKKLNAFQFVNRLAMSSDGKVLLAALGAPEPGQRNLSPDAGIYRSSNPATGDWQLVLNGYFSCVAFDPSDKTNSKAIAGVMGMRDNPVQGAYFSTDGGKSWTIAEPTDVWTGRAELAYARANPSIVYASVDQGVPVAQGGGGELWVSTDGGKNYRKPKGGQRIRHLSNQGEYANVIWAGHPTDPNLLVLGGLDLWRSTDGGKSFEMISNWAQYQTTGRSVHADQHVIIEHPGFGKDNHIVYFGNDGGIFRADDMRTTGSDLECVKGWTTLNNNYVVTQFYGAAGHAKTGALIAGAQDNGTVGLDLRSDNMDWSKVWGGDGGFCAIDQDDPAYRYGEYVWLSIFRIDKSGKRDMISGFSEDPKNRRLVRRPAPYHIPDAKNPGDGNDPVRANFIAPFILDPNNQNRLLAGGASLWVTNDARAPVTADTGPSWAPLKPPLPVPNFISAIAVAKGDSNVIWVGHNFSDVYMTTNGLSPKPKWTRVDNGKTPLPGRMVTRIAIDPKNHQHVYVTFSGYAENNLWKTEDGGKGWINLSSGLPHVPFRSIAMHPRRSSYVYLGTEIGVYASENGGLTWSATNEGPTNCRVDELFWMRETLLAATHGRGIFRINLARVGLDD